MESNWSNARAGQLNSPQRSRCSSGSFALGVLYRNDGRIEWSQRFKAFFGWVGAANDLGLLRRCVHYLFNRVTGVEHVFFGKCRMHQEHQARFPQLSRYHPALSRAQFFWEGFFKVNLTANPAKAGNAFGIYGCHNAIPVPALT